MGFNYRDGLLVKWDCIEKPYIYIYMYVYMYVCMYVYVYVYVYISFENFDI